MSINKNDQEARRHWGAGYDQIPKSVFAVIAWHFADRCSENGIDGGQAIETFMKEWEILLQNGFHLSKPTKKARGQQ